MEETLVEEQEEGELAHLSWVRNYDRPLPQVALFHYFIQDHAIARVTVHSNQETIHAAPN